MKRLAILCVAITGCAQLRTVSPWDVAMESAGAALLAVDGAQTQAGVRRCIEVNPLLTRADHCSNGVPVGGYFAAVAALHALVALLLPPGRARTAWQATMIGVEGHAAYRNHLRLAALRAGGGWGPQ